MLLIQLAIRSFYIISRLKKLTYADCDIYTITKITPSRYLYLQLGCSTIRVAPDGFVTDSWQRKFYKIHPLTDEVKKYAEEREYIRETFKLMRETKTLNYKTAVAIRAALGATESTEKNINLYIRLIKHSLISGCVFILP